MHENKFELQVREKMDHLGFDPSDAVWARVEKEINKDKKRHRPVFWLLFFSGLMLAGGGYYFSANKNSSNANANSKQQRGTDKKQDSQSTSKVEINMKESREKKEDVKKLAEGYMESRTQQYNVQTGRAQENKLLVKAVNQYKKYAKSGLKAKRTTEPIVLKSGKEGISSDGVGDFEKGESKKPEQSNNIKKNSIDSSAGNKINGVTENKTSMADSVSDMKITKNKKQKEKSSSWKIGLTGNAGISNINQSLFKSANGTNPSYYVYAPSGPPAGPAAVNASSEITAGFSFGIGVFVNRHLSKRISLSAGIDYHYYSTKINTGNVVDSSLLVYTGSLQASAVNTFYRNGNDHGYTNQYHFIALPVSINFQLNKSIRIPVIWEAGLSISYLLSSNALYFDPYANVYFKNNQLFNKTQLNMATAIMFGFPMHNGEVQLGPQLQYGLTGLLNTNTGNPEHLFYYGLKVSFIPGKK